MSLMKSFGVLKSSWNPSPQQYTIDNWMFRLHYKATVLFFLAASILVTSRQYIGEHIKCIADKGVSQRVMNSFCFFTSTFTVIKHLDANQLDSGNLAHPGVGPYGINSAEPIKKHAYYQWVPFVLFFQGIMFYLTHLLWKKMEGGRLKYLVNGLKYAAFSLEDKELEIKSKKQKQGQKKLMIPTKGDKTKKIQQIRNLFTQGIYVNRNWSTKLIVCEVLNVLHVIFQICLTNKFLGGHFISLGLHILSEGLNSNVDILDEVFPKVTKCTFHKYGPSGSIQHHDAMCVMALNVVNEKIYTGLWFWFAFILIGSILAVIWRILTIFLYSRSGIFNRLVFCTSSPGRLNPWRVLSLLNQVSFTDWLFLVYLSKNIDPMVFRDISQGISEDMQEKTGDKLLIDDVDGQKFS
ncbi:innexin inx7 [Leptinotarsa decemlineata]|uniref:innexin inx7 n=1 Tax=Leptinotarsa decemlineata TaxID=7539 RepID=UPI003D305C6C